MCFVWLNMAQVHISVEKTIQHDGLEMSGMHADEDSRSSVASPPPAEKSFV